MTNNESPRTSGYTPCACRDCMDATVSGDVNNPALCAECSAVGCSPWREGREPRLHDGTFYECQRPDAYGVGEPEHEHETTIGGLRITVDKDGGGTVGRSYDGDWTVAVANGSVLVYDNDTLTTGTPKTHAQVARMAFEFASESINEEA